MTEGAPGRGVTTQMRCTGKIRTQHKVNGLLALTASPVLGLWAVSERPVAAGDASGGRQFTTLLQPVTGQDTQCKGTKCNTHIPSTLATAHVARDIHFFPSIVQQRPGRVRTWASTPMLSSDLESTNFGYLMRIEPDVLTVQAAMHDSLRNWMV